MPNIKVALLRTIEIWPVLLHHHLRPTRGSNNIPDNTLISNRIQDNSSIPASSNIRASNLILVSSSPIPDNSKASSPTLDSNSIPAAQAELVISSRTLRDAWLACSTCRARSRRSPAA